MQAGDGIDCAYACLIACDGLSSDAAAARSLAPVPAALPRVPAALPPLQGCMIKERGADDVIAMPACSGVKVCAE